MRSDALGICSEPSEDEVDEHEDEAEKVDPESDTEDPLDDIDDCGETGYVDDGRTGTAGPAAHWSKGWRKFGTDLKGVSGAYWTSHGGVGGVVVERAVNLGQLRIKDLSSGMPILLRGSHSNIRAKIASSSDDSGSIELKNLGLVR